MSGLPLKVPRLALTIVDSMIAVMTMNVGYFLSVLGGIFLGTLIAGRFGSDAASGH